MTESLPMIEYLEECYPDQGVKLLPIGNDESSSYQRFKIRRLCEQINSGVQPLQNRKVVQKVVDIGGDRQEWGSTVVQRGLEIFESLLDSDSSFCVGD